mmetsp:Transcript_31779/g.63036  ORF Transcript_31779/g.63036 Transcript_31779/m.63036 type:complete len:80 (-) Transcript_31779:74-313(-)
MLDRLFAFFLLVAVASADVIAEEDSKFNEPYTKIVLWSLFASFCFLAVGITIRRHCTIKKGRTERGIITSMLLPEDEVL